MYTHLAHMTYISSYYSQDLSLWRPHIHTNVMHKNPPVWSTWSNVDVFATLDKASFRTTKIWDQIHIYI